MTEPIIVPVSAPGATEAASQVRTFAGTVAQSGAAAKEAATGHAGLAKATTATGQAAAGATAKTEAHVRSLDQEYARLKRAEEQALVTAAARRKLGESVNASDIGAIRRFTRGLPGGIGREAGRGIAEGIEGTEGSGLRSTLGLAGAGVAGGVIAVEAVSHAVEMIVEVMHHEIEERYRNIHLLEEADKRIADLGKGALDKYGDALASIAASGGEAAVGKAKDFALRNKDASGIEAYDMAAQHFEGASERGVALQAAEMYHQAGGGSLKDAMGKLTPERIQRMLAGGQGMASMVGEMFGDERGMGRISEAEIEKRISNRAQSPTAVTIDKLRGLENETDLGDIDKIPQAEGPIRKGKSEHKNEHAAQLLEENIKGREAYEKLQADNQMEREAFGGDSTTLQAATLPARMIYNSWQKIVGNGTANDRLDRAANAQYETAEKIMPGEEMGEAADHLRAAADILDGQRRGAPAMGATP